MSGTSAQPVNKFFMPTRWVVWPQTLHVAAFQAILIVVLRARRELGLQAHAVSPVM